MGARLTLFLMQLLLRKQEKGNSALSAAVASEKLRIFLGFVPATDLIATFLTDAGEREFAAGQCFVLEEVKRIFGAEIKIILAAPPPKITE